MKGVALLRPHWPSDKMKKILLSLLAISSFVAGSAFAADMPVKSPVYKAPPPAPIYSWTGWYIGGTAGGGWSNSSGINNAVTGTFCTVLTGCPAAGPALAAAVPARYGTNPSGFLGGGEAGYNWQAGRFLWGVETDFSGTGIMGSNAQTLSAPLGGSTIGVAGVASERLDWFGTVRGRLGVTITDPVLVYATGGFAYGHASSSTTLTETVGGTCFCGPSPTVASSASTTLAGWTVGGGLEWRFAANWTVKGEYLYYDLGSMNYSLPGIVQLNGAGTPFFGAGVAATASFRGSIARVGVNYQFGGPVGAKY
jgi:outer membrane immunogenic protein